MLNINLFSKIKTLFIKPAQPKTMFYCVAELYRGIHYLHDVSSHIPAASVEEAESIFRDKYKYCSGDITNFMATPLTYESVDFLGI
ncbi:hypothetical protein MCAMS1_02829 [biofilm metagenome]